MLVAQTQTLANKTIDLSNCFVTANGAIRYKNGNNTVNLLLPVHNSGTASLLDESNTVTLRNKQMYGTNKLYDGTLLSKTGYTITFPDKNCTLATTNDITTANGTLDSNDQLTNSAGGTIQFPTSNINTSAVTVQYVIFQNVNIFNTDYFDYFPHLSSWSGNGQKGLLSIQKFIYGGLNIVAMNAFSLSCWTSNVQLTANTNYKITDVMTKTDNYDPIILGQAFGFMQSDYVPSVCGVISLTQQGIYLSTSRTIDVHTRIICNGTFPYSDYTITSTNATYKNI